MNKFNIYVINLEKDKERLLSIQTKLYPNPIIRINAIYGKEQNYSNNQNIYFLSRYFVPKNAIACTLSHRLAIKTFLNSNTFVNSKNDIALILEDDAIPLTTDYIKKINNIIKTAPKDWHIIKLDYVFDNNYNKFTIYPTVLLTAYLINKKGAKKLLNKLVYWYPDVELNLFNNINIYNSPKRLFTQIYDKSSNNQVTPRFDPLFFINIPNFKIFRICNIELTVKNSIIILIIILLLYYFYVTIKY